MTLMQGTLRLGEPRRTFDHIKTSQSVAVLLLVTPSLLVLLWHLCNRGLPSDDARSEEHTSELQSPDHLVCRLLLEKKKLKSSDGLIVEHKAYLYNHGLTHFYP